MFKKLDLIFEDQTYSCEIKAENDELIICKIYQDILLNFEGKISLKEIYSQISAFDEYTMEELFKVINGLEKENFELLNSLNQFKLKIKIRVLKKVKELVITLETKSQSKEKIIQLLLKEVNNQTKKIELLEKELKNLSELKKKGENLEKGNKEKQEKENEENTFPDIDISKVKIQRKNKLFRGHWDKFKLLDDGRIAMRLYEEGIAVINPDSLEIMLFIRGNFLDYIGLKKDIFALSYDDGKISRIKLEDTKYQFIESIYYDKLGFIFLSKLSDGTLLVSAKKNHDWGEIIFYKEINNSYSKYFSIGLENDCLFALQISNNEIISTERRKRMFIYDFVNKTETINFDFHDKFDLYFSSDYMVEIISDNIMCITMNCLGDNDCYMINFREQTLINHFKNDNKFRYIDTIKGQYLFILKKNCIMQYKIENDNISLIQEFETSNDYDGLICLKNGNNVKYISYEGDNIYQLY